MEQTIKQMDPDALTGFYTSYKTRNYIEMLNPITNLDAARNPHNTDKILKVPTCIIIGDWARNYMEDAMELNSLINPEISNFVKMADAGSMVYEEQPNKVGESVKLFLQGQGYLANVLPTKLSELNMLRAEKLSRVSQENSYEGMMETRGM